MSDKTLGNLQDLRQRIYRKGKAEVVGGYGEDAQHRKYRPLASEQESGVREICMLRSTWRGMETSLRSD